MYGVKVIRFSYFINVHRELTISLNIDDFVFNISKIYHRCLLSLKCLPFAKQNTHKNNVTSSNLSFHNNISIALRLNYPPIPSLRVFSLLLESTIVTSWFYKRTNVIGTKEDVAPEVKRRHIRAFQGKMWISLAANSVARQP